jgi:predicted DCC family thiol-disulfide oxidoreductase YuxK
MSYSKFDTLLLMQDSRVFSYSTAALKISAHLGFPWRLLGIFVIVPPKVRDAAYKIIARNRFKWFGRKSICLIDVKLNKQRFLS